MAQNLAGHISRKRTAQSRPIPGQEARMGRNAAGGYTFTLDPWTRLRRFLVLGTEGGTYYIGEGDLTRDNARVVEECLAADPDRTVREIVDVSERGLAHKNTPAILALAVASAHADVKVRSAALAALPRVCRIPTHLFQFTSFVLELRGWGHALRKSVRNWYKSQGKERLARMLSKYQSREGWSHRDLLRLVHLKFEDPDLRWALDGTGGFQGYPDAGKYPVRLARPPVSLDQLSGVIRGFELAKHAGEGELVKLIHEYKLEREHLPSEALTRPDVWGALLPNLGLTAIIRNLGNMTKVGLLEPLAPEAREICTRLTDPLALAKARVHPMTIFIGAKTYASGHGLKGKGAWTPVREVLEALDAAFFLAMGNVQPSAGPNIHGVDVSGSMAHRVSGGVEISCAEAASALALVALRTEPNCAIMIFDTSPYNFDASKMTSIWSLPRLVGGGTDCSLPLRYAEHLKTDAAGVVIYTDNETWAGNVHAQQLVASYRQRRNPNLRMVNVGMAATPGSVADPGDPLSLNVTGLDASVPLAIQDFLGGL